MGKLVFHFGCISEASNGYLLCEVYLELKAHVMIQVTLIMSCWLLIHMQQALESLNMIYKNNF